MVYGSDGKEVPPPPPPRVIPLPSRLDAAVAPRPGTGLSGGTQPTEPGLTGGRSPHHRAARRHRKQCIGSLVPKAGAMLHLHQAKQSAYGFPCRSVVKNPPTKQETWVPSLVREDALEEEMATHSSILAWKILWTDGRLSMGSQRVRYNLATKQQFTSPPPNRECV